MRLEVCRRLARQLTGMLAHPEARCSLRALTTEDSCCTTTATATPPSMHSSLSHTQRGTADALLTTVKCTAGDAAATSYQHVDQHSAYDVLHSPSVPPRCAVFTVHEVDDLAQLLRRLLPSATPRAAPVPLAVWANHRYADVMHVIAWDGLPLSSQLVHCCVRLSYTLLRGYRLSRDDGRLLDRVADDVIIMVLESASESCGETPRADNHQQPPLHTLLQMQCPTLCCTNLAALAEITGLSLGSFWYTAIPSWRATRLAFLLGLPQIRVERAASCVAKGNAEQPLPHPSDRHTTELTWGAMCTAIAAALLQRHTRDVSPTPLGEWLSAPRAIRESHGLEHRCRRLLREIERVSTTAVADGAATASHGAVCVPPSPANTMTGMTHDEKAHLLQQLVAVWGPEAVPAPLTCEAVADGTSTEAAAPVPLPSLNTSASLTTADATCFHASGPERTSEVTDTATEPAVDLDFLTEALTPSARATPTASLPKTAARHAGWSQQRDSSRCAPHSGATRLPPSFLDESSHTSPARSPPFAARPQWTPAASAKQHRVRVRPSQFGRLHSAMSSDETTTFPLASAHSETADAVATHGLALDILDTAESPSQRRLRPW